MIEQVMIKKTLKAGENVWVEGSIINSPLPEILIDEVNKETGTVEVLKGDMGQNPNKLIFVAQKVEEKESKLTATSSVKTESGHLAVKKPEAQMKVGQRPKHRPTPKLKRRKK